ncbi:MAG TPA: hypothetical protein VM364_20010, partial [Vicinamibacterales bacterium]|nr:hypothetical protein [Vicinamibacterales bacterium]
MHIVHDVRRWSRGVLTAATLLLSAVSAAAQTEVVLHTKNASVMMGDWQMVADASAAGGTRMWNPDRGAARVGAPLASPFDYFELTFTAEAGRPYRLWVRARADNDHWANDSVFVQFSGAVHASGGAAYRIGTTDAATVSLEECNGCGSYRWGWNDNGWNGLGPVIYFATTGPQKVRIQKREDGISIDQVVLSASRYLTSSPGVFKNDGVILPASSTSTSTTTAASTSTTTSTATEIVIPVASAATLRGDWRLVADSTAATGQRVWNPDRGAAKLSSAAASPADYFDVTFHAEAGRPYRLWVRGKADHNSWANDSVFVQFNGSVNASGSAVWRIGTTSATTVSLEACSGCGVSGWGWEDNGYGSMGELVYFATTGTQTLRVQRREDGISIDQIVLSASKYLTAAPGAAKNDSTLLTGGSGSTTSSSSSTSSTTSGGGTDIILAAASSATLRGDWQMVSDSTAANGVRLWNPDRGAAKLSAAAASPADYFDVTFNAEAGRAYRLWMRGQGQHDHWANDSVFVQFSGSVTASGSPTFRIGTTSATVVSIERGTGQGLAKWGWNDNGWDGPGPVIYFATTGPQTLRVQRREDGISIDQIVLSPSTYLSSAPGAARNDNTRLIGSTSTSTSTSTSGSTSTTSTTTSSTSTAPAPSTTTGAVRLRVMEWNLHHGVGTDGVYDIERIATWMASFKPDVILLNEVEKNTWWGYEDQPARYKAMLEQKTGRRWYSHFSQEFGAWSSNGKGHQILSVYPFESTS